MAEKRSVRRFGRIVGRLGCQNAGSVPDGVRGRRIARMELDGDCDAVLSGRTNLSGDRSGPDRAAVQLEAV
jgi:hypothetical protein